MRSTGSLDIIVLLTVLDQALLHEITPAAAGLSATSTVLTCSCLSVPLRPLLVTISRSFLATISYVISLASIVSSLSRFLAATPAATHQLIRLPGGRHTNQQNYAGSVVTAPACSGTSAPARSHTPCHSWTTQSADAAGHTAARFNLPAQDQEMSVQLTAQLTPLPSCSAW